jgi:hypothetical protein
MIDLKKITTLQWRKHLASDAGMEGMLYLRERIPSVHKGTADEMIFEAGKVEGYKMAVDTISELIAMEQPKDQNASND